MLHAETVWLHLSNRLGQIRVVMSADWESALSAPIARAQAAQAARTDAGVVKTWDQTLAQAQSSMQQGAEGAVAGLLSGRRLAQAAADGQVLLRHRLAA